MIPGPVLLPVTLLLGPAPSQGVGSAALGPGLTSSKSLRAAHSHGPCPERKLPRVNTASSSRPPGSTTFHTVQMSSHKALSLGCRLVFLRMREPHPWQRGLGAILTSALFLLGCWGLSDFQQVGESAGVEVLGEPWGRESECLWVPKEGALGREGTAWGLPSALGFAPGQGADLSVGFWGWSVLTEEGMGFSILCPPPPTPPRLPLPLAAPLCHPLSFPFSPSSFLSCSNFFRLWSRRK